MLTLRETATRLRVSPRTVQRWIDAGALPAFRVGRAFGSMKTTLT